MHTQPYPYDKRYSTRYTFVSKGRKGAITKVVEFSPVAVQNIVNLGFGDLLPDNTVDDIANSNNGDIIKVPATVIAIVEDFTTGYPDIKIVFTGSTIKRTQFYQRILATYYPFFIKSFVITALYDNGTDNYQEVLFEPKTNNNYAAFYQKENNNFEHGNHEETYNCKTNKSNKNNCCYQDTAACVRNLVSPKT